MNDVAFCCDRCRDKVRLPANASYEQRKCRKCGSRYQRELIDLPAVKRNVVMKIFAAILVLAIVAGGMYYAGTLQKNRTEISQYPAKAVGVERRPVKSENSRSYGVYDRHKTLEQLKSEYGFSIIVPSEWSDPDYGFVVSDEKRLLTFLAKSPGANSESDNEMLEIYVKKSIGNGHIFACSGEFLSNSLAKDINSCAECTFVDPGTGTPIINASIKDIKELTFIGHRWFPPSIEKFYEPQSEELIGCQRNYAYNNRRYIVFSSYIVLPDFRVAVEFQLLPENYIGLVPSINKIIDSIEVRCGDSWCKPKPFGIVTQGFDSQK
jgi:hypothetical protein